ncbi:MFS transporter [Parasphingorhabdus pacifica]
MSTPTARFPRWFVLLFAATALANAVYNVVRVNASYRALALGGDSVTVGIIAASFALAPLLVALPVGRAVDRRHVITALVVGSVLTTTGAGLASTSTNLVMLGGANVILGLGQLLFTVGGQGMIAKRCSSDELDRRFGGLTLGVSLGQAVGLPLGGVVTALLATGGDHVDTTPALLTATALALLSVPLTCFLRMPPTATSPGERSDRQSGLTMLRAPGMKPAMYSSLAVLASVDVLTAYLPVFGHHYGIGVHTVTALLTARTLASLVSRFLLTRLVQTFPRRLLIVSATLCSAVPMALIPILPYPWVLVVCMVIAGFFMGIGQPLTMTWVVSLVTEQNRGAALSLRLSGNRLGQVAIPYAAGALAGVSGVGAVFGLTGVLLGVAAAFTARAPFTSTGPHQDQPLTRRR